MAQNIYDDEEFFVAYSGLRRSVEGLDGAPEWPTLRSMLPDMTGRRVVDLGCGFGWFSRWAATAGAASVLGHRPVGARCSSVPPPTPSTTRITYRRQDLEVVELPAAAFDVAYSSFTLHYLADLGRILATVQQSLVPGGCSSSRSSIRSTPPRRVRSSSPTPSRHVTWPLDQYLDRRTADHRLAGTRCREVPPHDHAPTCRASWHAGFVLEHF